MARLPGVSRAAPTPWRTRVAMSTVVRRSERARGRRDREPGHPDGEDPASAVLVTEGPAEQDERGHGERVPGDHPLEGAHRGMELPADGGQGDPDHGGVDGGHPRTEHGGENDPASGGSAEAKHETILQLASR